MIETELKSEIRKITPKIYRACYAIGGDGETTVPFDTEAEADAFLRGIRFAIQDMDGIKWKKEVLARIAAERERRTA